MDCEDPGARGNAIKTDDHLLGGRVRFAQPADGYRAAIDPVLLAASVQAEPEDDILDAGCGTGAAALCLAARVANCRINGVELNSALAGFARENAAANGFADRLTVHEGSFDIFAAENSERFSQVISNPPFYADGRHTPSSAATKAAAHGEQSLELDTWIKAAARALRPGGRFTVIHRADRIDELLRALDRRFGATIIFPLWPRNGVESKRILLTAVKGRRTPPRLMSGLVLHESDGVYTAAAQAILRDARPLDLGSGSE